MCWFVLQGNLDLQYLSTRYQRGKDWTDKFMSEHHQHREVNSLSEAHAEVLKFQSACGDGGDALFACSLYFILSSGNHSE